MAKKASQPVPESSGNRWQDLLNEMKSSGSGPWFFPKPGKTRFRIVTLNGVSQDEATPSDFMQEVEVVYRGQLKTRFLVRAVILGTSQGEISDRFSNKVVPILLPKVAVTQILSMLAEGEYELFDPIEGHGLTLDKTGEGRNTSYSLMPTSKPIPLDMDEIEDDGISMAELAEQFYHWQSSRGSESSSSQDASEDNGW